MVSLATNQVLSTVKFAAPFRISQYSIKKNNKIKQSKTTRCCCRTCKPVCCSDKFWSVIYSKRSRRRPSPLSSCFILFHFISLRCERRYEGRIDVLPGPYVRQRALSTIVVLNVFFLSRARFQPQSRTSSPRQLGCPRQSPETRSTECLPQQVVSRRFSCRIIAGCDTISDLSE